jgi:hypothetical protein
MKRSVLCKLVAFLSLAVAIALPAVCGAQKAATKPVAPAATPSPAAAGDKLCPNPPPCKAGHTCSNYPFAPTDCWTTKYGPAKADVIIGAPKTGAIRSPNMLYCEGNTYALCFFSGPPDKGLPCVVNGDGANCTCQAYTSGPNFVDINGILNQGAYFKTVDVCGQDGSRCKNIVNCGPRGDLPGCKKHPEAPVCKYVKDQNPNDPQASLMPKADLISTFSFAMSGKNGPYKLGSTPCSGLYAGCMTAPCTYGPNHKSPTTDGEPVQCQCPTYNGRKYQIGQNLPSCSITDGYVWSASNTVKPKSGGK